jgi:hypothetical protein
MPQGMQRCAVALTICGSIRSDTSGQVCAAAFAKFLLATAAALYTCFALPEAVCDSPTHAA